MTTTLPMRTRSDAAALRQHLREICGTEDVACCHSLLSMSFVSFEQRCLQAMAPSGGGASFRALLPDRLILEYQLGSVLVRRSVAGLGGVDVAATGKREVPET